MIVISREEKKIFTEILAITWEEQDLIKGQFTVEGLNEEITSPPEIWITFTNESGEAYRTELHGVTISQSPESPDIWDFEALEATTTVLYDYLYWN